MTPPIAVAPSARSTAPSEQHKTYTSGAFVAEISKEDVGKISSEASSQEKDLDLEAQPASAPDEKHTDPANAGAPDPNVVDFDGPDDPQNPRNWSAKKKWANITVISSITFLTPLASSMFAPGILEVMTEFHSTNEQLAAFVVSIYVLGYAAGPVVLAPLSELYGRLPLYHCSNLGFIVFTVACALSTNLNMLIGFRFISGLFGSCPLTIGGGTIADLIPQEKRGGVMAIWVLGPLMGPIIGPVAGGYLTDAAGWRWTFWVIAIANSQGGVIASCGLFALRETYPVVLLERKAARLRKETGNPNIRSKMALPYTPAQLFKVSIVRPMKLLLFSPIVLALSTYIAVVYGYLYLLFTTINEVFAEKYHFSQGSVGLTYLGIGMGSLFGVIIFGVYSDKLLQYLTNRSSTGERKPEYRLPPLIPGSFVIPIGLFIYGWTADKGVHWIAPIIGTSFVGFGLLATFMPIQTYLVDAFTIYAASALAANTIFRSLIGALLPLAGRNLSARIPSVLVIIDAQNEYASGKLAIHDVQASRKKIAGLLAKWRHARGDVVHVLHQTPEGAPIFTAGTELVEEFEELKPEEEEGREMTITKAAPSAFTATELDAHLKKLGKNKVVLVGYMAHVCISSTSRAGFELGYDISIVRDGVGDRDIPGAEATQLVQTVLADLFVTRLPKQTETYKPPDPYFNECTSEQRGILRRALNEMDRGVNRAGVALDTELFTLMNNHRGAHAFFDQGLRNLVERNLLPYTTPPRKPIFYCVSEEKPLPQILSPGDIEKCLDGKAAGVFHAETGRVFVCPSFYDFPLAPPTDPCPTVVDNKFEETGYFEQAQGFILLWGLLPMYFDGVGYTEEGIQYKTLNKDVEGRNRVSSNAIVGYMLLAMNQCMSIPDVTKPPWTNAVNAGGDNNTDVGDAFTSVLTQATNSTNGVTGVLSIPKPAQSAVESVVALPSVATS
ncbi:uncharacterized protein KY384_008877 [Bacidia gigantensis]|uniref:uncharacterized protein n=1 Tax=Bacidia gigantensis TaxID=2732470 RepID=UPI001D03BF86|nr:uncharacterized protein KY384_008877 [Bacidia gigantensis]KAG8525233.1 hypothetical protein KY384_008877 [Bacidia gigantensis]